MLQKRHEELSQVRDLIVRITDLYSRMSTLIDEEHDIIRTSDLDQLEAFVPRKMETASSIERDIQQLRNICRQLHQDAAMMGFDVGDDLQLSSVIGLIDAIRVTMSTDDQEAIATLVDEIHRSYEEFFETRQSSFTKFEVNRLVVSRLLAERQENYRFWQEVTADMMAAYDKGGKQKAQRSSSTLNVKA